MADITPQFQKQIDALTTLQTRGGVLTDLDGFRQTVEDIDTLTLDPQNANTHPDANKDGIWRSLNQFGFRKNAVAVQEKTRIVYAGNGVVEVLRNKGIAVCPVVWIPADFTETQCKAFALADNETGKSSVYDLPQLDATLEEISVEFSPLDVGFDEIRLGELFAGGEDERTDRGEADAPPPEPPEPSEVVSRPGDLWRLGEHRILCGDSTKTEDVQRLIGNEKIQCAFTSPPYAEQRKSQYGGIPADEYVDWWESVQANVRSVLKDDGSFFVNIKPNVDNGERLLYVMDLVLAMKRRWGWAFIDEFCWLRLGLPGKVQTRFKNAFESIFWFANHAKPLFIPDAVRHYSEDVPVSIGGGRNMAGLQGVSEKRNIETAPGLAYPSNVLDFKHVAPALGHPAAYPVILPSFFLQAYSHEQDVWLDPFLGSGTTLIACAQLNRRCFGMEIAPAYVDVICRRYVEYIDDSDGVECERDGESIPFAQLFPSA